MTLRQFFTKQLIDVIQWNEPVDGILAYRFPMRDMEIQNGGQLTVRESQMAAFVNEGRIADVFGPGLYTLTTRNLPLLTDLLNWDKGFQSPFKSDVYFFATRLQIDQKWGTATPITVRDKEFGAVSLRCYGIYSYRISDPRTFFTQISGTREIYFVADLEGQLRNTIIARMTEIFANSDLAFLDLTANQAALGSKLIEQIKPAFSALGLALDQFVVENISLPDELQKNLDQRIGMNIVGDLGRYTQFAAAESMPIAAANSGGAAGMGMGLGAGAAVGQTMMSSLQSATAGAASATAVPAATKFCTQCGKSIPQGAHFCPECGKQQ
ncbi:MAG TPA: SPFH domain-containing protein [Silvibacterium sp.]|nr:SPFH domain-containing protein [Silvibacterium sp.]